MQQHTILEIILLVVIRMREDVKLPTETAEALSSTHRKCEKEAIAAYIKVAIFDHDHAYQKLLQV